MTTKFDSFDSSPLGAFVQSPLGARNRTVPPAEFYVFVVWGSMKGYFPEFVPPGAFEEDVNNWTVQSNQRPADRFVAAWFDTGFFGEPPPIPNLVHKVLSFPPPIGLVFDAILDLLPP